jgi:hypothetical protein
MKTIPMITKEQYINVLDISHLCKDPETEELKTYCKNKELKKQKRNDLQKRFYFFIYLLALLGAIHTIIFYINLFIK